MTTEGKQDRDNSQQHEQREEGPQPASNPLVLPGELHCPLYSATPTFRAEALLSRARLASLPDSALVWRGEICCLSQ